MATTKVTPDADTIVSEIQIAAPPERVFKALTDPEQIMQWWRNDTITIEQVRLEPKVGGQWGYETGQVVDGTNKFRVQGKVLEYDPPRRLAYTWLANLHADPTRQTVVRWELAPVQGGTRVRLTHSGLAQEPKSREGYRNGWPGLVERLRKFAEQPAAGGTAATTRMTPDNDAMITEIQIGAPADRVFQALIDPQQLVQWWGQKGIYRCTNYHSDLRPGGEWRSQGIGPDGGTFIAHGEYLEIDRPRLLAYTWIASWTGDLQTTLRWELEPAGQGTLVRIRHSGFAAHPELAQSYRGWPRMLGWLQALLERGETVEDRPAASWQS